MRAALGLGDGLGRSERRFDRDLAGVVREVVPFLLDVTPIVLAPVIRLGLGLGLRGNCERLGHEGLGLVCAGDGDVAAVDLAPRRRRPQALRANRAGDLAGAGSGPADGLAGSAHELSDGGAGEQEDSGDQHQDGDDVGADALEEVRRRPVEGLAGAAAVLDHELLLEEVTVAGGLIGAEARRLSGEGKQQPAEEQDAAGVERRGRLDQRPGEERATPGSERDRDDVGDLAGAVLEPGGKPAADATAVPVHVEDECEKDRRGDERQADDVVVALLEALDGVAQVPPTLSRSGLASGLACAGGACRRTARARLWLWLREREIHLRRR